MSPVHRAWLTAHDGGLAIGDPGREHLLLLQSGMEHHGPDPVSGELLCRARWPWSDVVSLTVRARVTERSTGSRRAFWISAVLEAIGFGYDVTTSAVTATVALHDLEPVQVLCDGLPGSAYRRDEHLEALELIGELVESPQRRGQLDRPESLLT